MKSLDDMISFVVPAYNEERLIGGSLIAIKEAVAGLNQAFEIIVVDDNSDDQTAAIASRIGARVVQVKKRQIAATRNAGARQALGQAIFFIDADTLINKSVIEGALRELRRGAVGGGATVQFEGRQSLSTQMFVRLGNTFSRLTHMAPGCFMFCTREAFAASGGFDETFYCAEELVFSNALKRHGSFVILGERVTTSARKLSAYSGWQLVRMMASMLWRGPKALKQRRGLDFWYDPISRDAKSS